jgi:aminopeptidase N
MFTGNVKFNFELSKVVTGLHLDFNGQDIHCFKINDSKVREDIATLWNGTHLLMPSNYLKEGTNSIDIDFGCKFVKDGNGFHSMKDADGKMYCYSTAEPYYANRIFPLFDQPNLKNSFTLSVNAPEDWTIISNEARTGELET